MKFWRAFAQKTRRPRYLTGPRTYRRFSNASWPLRQRLSDKQRILLISVMFRLKHQPAKNAHNIITSPRPSRSRLNQRAMEARMRAARAQKKILRRHTS